MKKIRLIFDGSSVHCFLPEGSWWKQLLINRGIGLIAGLILSLFFN